MLSEITKGNQATCVRLIIAWWGDSISFYNNKLLLLDLNTYDKI